MKSREIFEQDLAFQISVDRTMLYIVIMVLGKVSSTLTVGKWSFQFKGSFKNHVDTFSLIFDRPPTSVDTFYVLNMDKNGRF